MNRLFLCAALVVSFTTAGFAGEKEEGWISLFNGKDLTGWKASENGNWKVVDGALVASGKRTHLFTEKEFKNFEFKAEVMTKPGSNGGIYFHTAYHDSWPIKGYESQVNVTQGDRVKTGSLYNVVRLFETPAQDNKWWEQTIIVKGKEITIKIDGKVVVNYIEPEGATGYWRANKKADGTYYAGSRILSKGSFALQHHDPGATIYYRNIRVKPLAD